MKKIDDNIEKFLSDKGYSIVSVVNENERKGTIVVKAFKKNRYFILKLYLKNNIESCSYFGCDEVEWYKIMSKCNLSPKVYEHGECFFSVFYVGENTLWEYFQEKDIGEEYYKIKNNLCSIALGFHCSNVKKISKFSIDECVNLVMSRLYNILLSGPKNTQNKKYLNEIILRSVYRLVYFPLKNKIRKSISLASDEIVCFSDRYHGDLHMNNIILGENFDCYLVDFECSQVGVPGFLPDIIYMTTTLEGAAGRGGELLDQILSEGKFSPVCRDAVHRIFSIFLAALQCNTRFWNIRVAKATSSGFREILSFALSALKPW